MANNILLFTIFALAIVIIYYSVSSSARKFILLASNAVFYLSISTCLGGGG